MNYSKAPIFFAVPHSYQERAYDVYSYLGYHLSCTLDLYFANFPIRLEKMM